MKKRANNAAASLIMIAVSSPALMSATSAPDGIQISSQYFYMLGVAALALVALILYLYQRAKKAASKLQVLLNEKDEKIKWLRQIGAENDHKYTKKAHDAEKTILELTHKVSDLEARAKEGTKNQVVSKIEAQQSKREKAIKRAGLKINSEI